MVKRAPTVALVGRPNVGKSSLFNRLVGRRQALVHDLPGVTRDRMFGEARVAGRLLRLVDTGGFDTGDDPIMSQVRGQTQLAIEEADLVVLVLDAQSGALPDDEEIAGLLRRAHKPTIAVANKVDVPEHELQVADLYRLGIDPLMPVSAEHGRGIGELVEALVERLDPPHVEEHDAAEAPLLVGEEASVEESAEAPPTRIEWDGGPIRVAVVGRPNAGKSSLINRLLGEERHLATDVPGTTRDAVDSAFEQGGQHYVFTDTAGIRRKRAIAERLERFSVMMAMRALDGADVAVVVLDATQAPSDQDARIISLAAERGKGVVLAANKWDLISAEAGEAFQRDVERQLGFASYAPLERTSAKSGRGLIQLLDRVVIVQKERHRRVATGELNRFFREVVEHTPPPTQGGRRPKLYFVSQPLVRPPTFIFTAGNAEIIRDSYTRYLVNSLRKRYGFVGTPVWVKYRKRGKQKRKG